MSKKNMTRHGLLMSVISLILCCAMLVGTTMAWFTDAVSSTNNKIVAGNLDIELKYKLDLKDEWQTVTPDAELFDDDTLWEPGTTQVVYLDIINNGSLALKYQIGLNVVSEVKGYNEAGDEITLSDYIHFGTTTEQPATREAAREAIKANATTIFDTYAHPRYNNGNLLAGENTLLTLVAYMPETVNNEANYRGSIIPKITMGLNLVATQYSHESDSFNNLYDENADWSKSGYGAAMPPADDTSAVELIARDPVTNAKVATAVVYRASVADPSKLMELIVKRVGLDSNVTVNADQSAATYDVTVTNIAEGNTQKIKVELRVGTGLTGVSLYHNATPVTGFTYNSSTGYVIFETTSFSPFTVVYDAEPEQDTPALPEDMPVAIVTDVNEDENVPLDWKSFSSVPAADPAQKLEAVYQFSAPHDSTTVQTSPYKDWHCDYVVSIDKDIPADAIFLGGNYGNYGWVGFNNPLSVAANEEVYLLGSVTGNPWTYESIVGFVGTFKCGVAEALGNTTDLTGATFTVRLRLTNPEDETEYYDVNTVRYTFGATGTLPVDMPVAIVTDVNEDENVSLDWKGFSSVPAADPAQKLEAVYQFSAPHDSTTVQTSPYKDWHCDYVVSIDKDIPADAIFLGGNYGNYGWVGFNNPLSVAANEEVYLLGSVTGNPWTYESIVGFVGTFKCGVAEALGNTTDLTGATFTVRLRLTNPENGNEYYDVNTVEYVFR